MKLKTKYCVIGSGAGGSIVSYILAKSGEDVLVLNTGKILAQDTFQNELTPQQKGNFGINKDTTFPIKLKMDFSHPLYAEDGEKSIKKQPLEYFQHFQIHHVNGLQNLWNAISLRYSQDDFANRNNPNPNCQWQVSYQEMADHYSAVEQLISVTGNQDQISQFPDGRFISPKSLRDIDEIFLNNNKYLENEDFRFFANRKAIDLDEQSKQKCVSCGSCVNGCYRGSIYKFSTRLYPDIQHLKNFKILENIRVIKIESLPEQKTKIIGINEQTSQMVEVETNILIMAAGAIESPRLLLNSFSPDVPAMDQVGKYLQDSPYISIGSNLLKAWFKPVPRSKGYGDHLLFGGKLKVNGQKSPFLAQLWSDFVRLPVYLSNISFLPRPLKRLVAKQIYHSTVGLLLWGSAIPKKDNCLQLSDDRDQYGQRQLDVHYQRDPRELDVIQSLESLGYKLLKNAGGIAIISTQESPGKGIHYVGTCRMGASADQGVVDQNLKFYGADNIYVCDGSVIPRLSEKHPTLTIMALSHRLGQYLLKTY
ncbi:MAG: GMC oxidoreductase [Crocosphaera sp.]